MTDEQNPYEKESGGLINLRIWGMGSGGGEGMALVGQSFISKLK